MMHCCGFPTAAGGFYNWSLLLTIISIAEMMLTRMLCVGAYSLQDYGLLYKLQGVVILHMRLSIGLWA